MKASELAMCSVCAGAGKPVSGTKCICGGSGLEVDEILGLRGECFRLRDKFERFIALADDEDEKAPLFKSPPNLDGVQMSERELAAYHLGREHVAKRLQEIAHESG